MMAFLLCVGIHTDRQTYYIDNVRVRRSTRFGLDKGEGNGENKKPAAINQVAATAVTSVSSLERLHLFP